MKKLLLLIPIIVLIVGCGGDEDNYFPLTVGNEWTYDMTMTMTDPDTTITVTGTTEAEITVETTLDNGTAVFEMIMTMTSDDTLIPTFVDTSYLGETEDYLLMYDTKAATVPDDTMLALPLETGKTWEDCEVMGQENVTVPAGTFNDCWKMREVDDEDTMYWYCAANVGMVKWSESDIDADTTNTMLMELEIYTIK